VRGWAFGSGRHFERRERGFVRCRWICRWMAGWVGFTGTGASVVVEACELFRIKRASLSEDIL
jgi:hypothetical protein